MLRDAHSTAVSDGVSFGASLQNRLARGLSAQNRLSFPVALNC